MDLCLLGTGGMLPLPGRFLTSLWMRRGGRCLLIDCGEGTQVALHKHGKSPARIEAILLTHCHADHVAGLPGLLLAMGNAGRREAVRLIGPAGVRPVLEAALAFAPETPFEVVCEELDGPERAFAACGCQIEAFAAEHSVPCYGYSVLAPRAGRFHAERAKALGVPRGLWRRLQAGEPVAWAGGSCEPSQVLGPPRKGLKATYCTDSRPTARIEAHARGSDLLILEGIYGDPAKEEKAREKRHMMMREAAALAARAQVPELWLTHYSPSMPDPQAYMDDVRRVFPNAVAAEDGMEKGLCFLKGE